jgi:quinoprotein glucose dehydrogenase
MRLSRLFLIAPVIVLPALFASPEAPKSSYNPKIAKASDEAEKAIPRFTLDKSLKVEVWAAEPMLANPVCFAFDEKGTCYVAETFRLHHGVTDTRNHMNWLDDDLACRTIADRIAKYKKYAGAKFHDTYEIDRDRIRRLEDTTGSGRADKSTVFRDDFGRAEDGIGAGLLVRKGSVYYTCIPDLYVLKDTKGTGVANERKSLATGFGVHTGFLGHDMHGLVLGPDGRLYFSIGDRGFNVKTKEGKHLYNPDSGAVLRCELDGSNLEIFATGLRNPQELAFDDYGNLFTVDNNSDSGDQVRFLHIVQGGDYGWRMGYQYETAMHDETVKQGNRGPWNYEQLWKPDTQAAYILPAIKNFANGPSGLAYYPGVGLSDRYKGHFFLANFSGNTQNSGIFSFAAKPKGASFEMVDEHRFIWNILATDCDFGPDGAFYVSDWVDGWGLPSKGRIYKVSDPEAMKNSAVADAKKLLAEGMEGKSVEELLKLLGHPHRGVRMEAQFALATLPAGKAFLAFHKAIAEHDLLTQLHAVWGLQMVARVDRTEDAYNLLANATDVENPIVRAEAVRALAEHPNLNWRTILERFKDPDSRVRMAAALSLSRNKFSRRVEIKPELRMSVRTAAFDILRENNDVDPELRLAGIELLAEQVPTELLVDAIDEKSPAVRRAVVVALRRKNAPEVAAFLADGDAKIVAEAARAINDQPITAALPKLTALINKPDLPRVVAYRVLNAHFLLGKPENAHALAAYAAQPEVPTPLRALAVKMLGEWPKPPRRDYITGLTQSLPERPVNDAKSAFTSVMAKVFAGPDAVRKAATTAATKLGIKEVGPFLIAIVNDSKAESNSRVGALNALAALKDAKLDETAKKAVSMSDPQLRAAGRAILIKKDAAGVMKQLRDVLAGTNVVEQQGALSILAANPSADADALTEEWLDKLIAKSAKPELSLEILEAAGASKSERIKRRLAGFDEGRPKDEIGKFRESLAGGDAVRGKEIFLSKTAVECQRCHKLEGQGGEVGPPLNGVGKQTREYLLEAIVVPSKTIAKGYESVLITTLDGKSVSGVLKGEDDKELRLMTAEGKLVTVKKTDVDDRRATKSAMPDDLVGKLTKRELRDLVEFLSRLKEEWKK